MKKFQLFLMLMILLSTYSCEKTNNEVNDVIFDTSFLGAKLDSITHEGDNNYTAYIYPENVPINKSPWFAFAVTAKSKKQIVITFNYGNFEHRYIPKLSSDRMNWENIDDNAIRVDNTTGMATIVLDISPQKTYVAAQEIESSVDTYAWVDMLVEENAGLSKIITGKTVLNKDLFTLQLESENIENSIVLIARQHPPEIPGGTIGFKTFFETLMSDTEKARAFREKFNIYAFPLLNPDGVDMGHWRHNANGEDLNRDWIDFTQPETQTVKNFIASKINEGKKIQFGLDFHTSFSGPYMLVLDSINELETSRVVPDWIQGIQTNSEFEVEARRRSQELPYCYNYFFNEFGCEAVTYEEGDEIERDVVKNRAKMYAEELMKTLIDKEIKNALVK